MKDGLHALIDIGAATLDVATFNVVLRNDQASPPHIPIFFSAVRYLGTHYLRLNRHSRLGLDLSWNDATPVESSDDFGQRNGSPVDQVVAADEKFVGLIVSLITRVINETRTNGKGSPEQPDRFGQYLKDSVWRQGLPIFVTGGGSCCELYRRAIDKVELELKKKIGSSNDFRFIELGRPGAKTLPFEGKAGIRLAVAHGLTEDASSIARVVAHRDIEPITQGTRERIDHTDLYGDR